MSPNKALISQYSSGKAAALARVLVLLAAVSITGVLLYMQLASASSLKVQRLYAPDGTTDSSLGLLSQMKQQLQEMQSAAAASKAQLAQVQDLVSSTKGLVQTAVHNCLKQPMAGHSLPGLAVTAPADEQVATTPQEEIAAAIAAEAESNTFKHASVPAAAAAAAADGARPLIETPYVGSALVEFKGHKLQLVALKNDEVVGAWVLKERKPFEPDYLNIILDFVMPGSVVVDAGANMGTYSTFFAARTGEKGAVYAFEPQKRMHQVTCSDSKEQQVTLSHCISQWQQPKQLVSTSTYDASAVLTYVDSHSMKKVLVTNMLINGLTWLQPINAALSYEKGVLHMQGTVTHGQTVGKAYTEADNNHQSINYGGQRLGAGGEEVQAVTLDSFNLTNVALIKVDVQWAEKMMLYGARETIKRNMPVVSYELPDPNYLAALESEVQMPDEVRFFNYDQFLLDLGYRPLQDFSLVNDRVMLPPKLLAAGRRLKWRSG